MCFKKIFSFTFHFDVLFCKYLTLFRIHSTITTNIFTLLKFCEVYYELLRHHGSTSAEFQRDVCQEHKALACAVPTEM